MHSQYTLWMRTTLTIAGFAIAVFALLASPGTAGGQFAPDRPDSAARLRYRATRAVGDISVDGRLDEPAWQQAAVIDRLTQVEPANGEPSAFRTEFRIIFDSQRLYLGVVAWDTAGRRGVRVQDLRRKFDFFANDLAGIVLDPLHDGRNSVSFQTNPYGAQRELQIFDGEIYNREWEGVWRTRAAITDSGWTAEVAIPWQTLRYRNDGKPWNMNLVRIARRANEQASWAPFPRNFTVYRMDYAGVLEGLEPPPPRTNVQFRPYTLLDASRSGPSGQRLQEATPSLGGEVIWRPTTNLQVDATVRTDFAQADVDRQVVNLRRFSVFFPERRQFFLENASLFNVGTEDNSLPVLPFFSRSIGLDAGGNIIPIQAGARATWRDARTNGGAVLLRQDGSGGRGAASIGAARVSRNLGGNSRVGLLFTGRHDAAGDSLGRAHGGTASLDGFTRFTQNTQASWMVSASQNGLDGSRGLGGSGFIGRQTNTLYTGVITAFATRGYNPSTGFVGRTNVLLTSPGVILDLRPAWRPKAIRNFRPGGYVNLYHGPQDGRLQEGLLVSYVDVIWLNGTLLYPYLEHQWQRPTQPFELVRGITVPAGTLDYTRGGLFLRTDQSARVSGQGDVSHGGFFGGTSTQASGNVRWAPSPRVALQVNYDVAELRRVGSSRGIVQTRLVAPELRLAWNPRLQFSSFYQYNTSAERGTLNARFSWEFAPLSYLYVVYNDRRAIGDARRALVTGLPTEQLLVKFVYLWQR
jgi:hypothetical protein